MQQWESQRSFCSDMQWVTGLQFYSTGLQIYVIADPNVGEQHAYRKYSNQWKSESSYCSAIQWATGLQFHYVIADPKVGK